MSFRAPNKYRVRTGKLASTEEYGNNGAFVIPLPHGQTLHVLAGEGLGWEHVSVSREDRCPTWSEMCIVKNLFWEADDCVVQYHPPKSDYVNCHPYCLHLWRPIGFEIPMPPSWMVGPI